MESITADSFDFFCQMAKNIEWQSSKVDFTSALRKQVLKHFAPENPHVYGLFSEEEFDKLESIVNDKFPQAEFGVYAHKLDSLKKLQNKFDFLYYLAKQQIDFKPEEVPSLDLD